MPKNAPEFRDMIDRRLEEARLPRGVIKLAIESRIGLDPLYRTADQYIRDFILRAEQETERHQEDRRRKHVHLNCGNKLRQLWRY